MSALAPAMPSCSLPAIGCPPTKRGSLMSASKGAFTLPTSVTQPDVAVSASATASCVWLTAVATKVIWDPSSMPVLSMAPISRAWARRSGSMSVPLTCQPAFRRAKPTDPPISPVPMTVARACVSGIVRRISLPSLSLPGLSLPNRRAEQWRLPDTQGEARTATSWCRNAKAPSRTRGWHRSRPALALPAAAHR